MIVWWDIDQEIDHVGRKAEAMSSHFRAVTGEVSPDHTRRSATARRSSGVHGGGDVALVCRSDGRRSDQALYFSHSSTKPCSARSFLD